MNNLEQPPRIPERENPSTLLDRLRALQEKAKENTKLAGRLAVCFLALSGSMAASAELKPQDEYRPHSWTESTPPPTTQKEYHPLQQPNPVKLVPQKEYKPHRFIDAPKLTPQQEYRPHSFTDDEKSE